MSVNYFAFAAWTLVATAGAFSQVLPDPPNKPALSRLLSIEEVQNEIEMTTEQVANVKLIEREMIESIEEIRVSQVKDAKNGEQPSFEKTTELVKSKMAECDQKVRDEVLVGFQVERLDQIAWRMEIQRNGVARFLEDKGVSEFLQLSDKDRKGLGRKFAAEKLKFAKEVQRLQKEMEERMISFLPAESQKGVATLIGEELKMPPPVRDREQIRAKRKAEKAEIKRLLEERARLMNN